MHKAFTQNKRHLFCLLFFFITVSSLFAQEKEERYYQATVAFYNLENLFDTFNDTLIDDEEFLPGSEKNWTMEKYKDKLNQLSTVIEKLGDDDGPEILGISEIENRKVVEDLIHTDRLISRGYEIAHIESPDLRGVDVGLIYKKKFFTPISTTAVQVIDSTDLVFKTRNLLVVTGVLSNDTITFMVNHWPSRRGGGKDEKRIVAAKTARRVVDSLLKQNPQAKIILMGDFNDDPVDASIYDYLIARPEKKLKLNSDLYNPMHSIFKNGYGSLSYQGQWNLFDQLIMTQSLLINANTKYFFMRNSAAIYSKKWLLNDEGKYTGAPFRTWSGSTYIGGFSDHLPVYLYLLQKVKD